MQTACLVCEAVPGAGEAAGAVCAHCQSTLVPEGGTQVSLITRTTVGERAAALARIELSPAFRARYELGSILGAGAMGMVCRALDRQMNRPVAIKFLSLIDDPGALERFLREGRMQARIDHPNVVPVYDLDVLQGHPYMVTELLEGGTLRTRLQRGAFPAARAVEVALQILAGLGACHAGGVLHRDLKPENILFGAGDQACVLLATALEKLEGDSRIDAAERRRLLLATLRLTELRPAVTELLEEVKRGAAPSRFGAARVLFRVAEQGDRRYLPVVSDKAGEVVPESSAEGLLLLPGRVKFEDTPSVGASAAWTRLGGLPADLDLGRRLRLRVWWVRDYSSTLWVRFGRDVIVQLHPPRELPTEQVPGVYGRHFECIQIELPGGLLRADEREVALHRRVGHYYREPPQVSAVGRVDVSTN